MSKTTRRSLILPAVALLAGGVAAAGPSLQGPPLGAGALRQARDRQGAQVALARAHLETRRAALGMGSADALQVRQAFTNGEGQAVVRLEQRHAGYRVVGAGAVARVAADGTTQLTASNVGAAISLPAAPRVTPQRAAELALARLSPSASLARAPKVEQVVFPARAVGSPVFVRDPATGGPMLDRVRSVHARVGTPWVWAYAVATGLELRPEGPRELLFFVHGDTGEILRVNDLVMRVAPEPVTGTGTGLYCGEVELPTARMADGTYSLYDPTRGVLPNPGLAYFTPDDSGWSPTGLQAWYSENDVDQEGTGTVFLFQSNRTNSWGDGQPFTSWGQEGGRNGQTAGVDAMHGLTTTWDFYEQVLGRSGMDGQGTSAGAVVHLTSQFYRDNAWWSAGESLAYLGAGSWPADPNGLSELTELDVIAHEMTHGITSSADGMGWVNSPGYEEAGLSEGTSDFFAQMVKLYAARAPGAPTDAVPNAPGDWSIATGAGHGTPLRWLDRPSRDERSPDAWFDGVRYMDGHYSAGVLSRALYFLARGASSDPASDAYSPYLPEGLVGVGNDIAARIWFKAVTERLPGDGTGELSFQDARAAGVAAAEDLYGAGSGPAQAVALAFAAVNVGDAPGAAPHLAVRFADWRNGDYIEASHFSHWANKEAFPKGEVVRPRITVENADDASVTWSVGGSSMFNGAEYFVEAGGTIDADGAWHAPNRLGWFSLTATSNQDPLQRAEGRVFLLNLDNDADTEQDAVDMGAIAFSWYLSNGLTFFHSVYQAPWVDDGDVGAFTDAMHAAWPAP